LDDFCDPLDTLAVGVGKWLRDWRVHPYFARRSSHCAGTGPLSETMTAAMICHIFANTRDYEKRSRQGGFMSSVFFLVIPGLIVLVIVVWVIRWMRGKDQDGNTKMKDKKDRS
jgi:hypothetical protein